MPTSEGEAVLQPSFVRSGARSVYLSLPGARAGASGASPESGTSSSGMRSNTMGNDAPAVVPTRSRVPAGVSRPSNHRPRFFSPSSRSVFFTREAVAPQARHALIPEEEVAAEAPFTVVVDVEVQAKRLRSGTPSGVQLPAQVEAPSLSDGGQDQACDVGGVLDEAGPLGSVGARSAGEGHRLPGGLESQADTVAPGRNDLRLSARSDLGLESAISSSANCELEQKPAVRGQSAGPRSDQIGWTVLGMNGPGQPEHRDDCRYRHEDPTPDSPDRGFHVTRTLFRCRDMPTRTRSLIGQARSMS